MATHPAKYTDSFIPIFANLLLDCKTVLDPFGGTGKLNKTKETKELLKLCKRACDRIAKEIK